MLVSTKGRYALRVMVDLAEHCQEGRIPLRQIAVRQGISEKYLENILSTLVRHGMLSGLRGKGGGYCLTREPDQFSVGEILRLTVRVWKELDDMIQGYLDGVTIADLVCDEPAEEE